MTGNTVLLAIAAGTGKGAAAARSGVALGGFCLGVVAASLVLRLSEREWPRNSEAAIALQLVALLALASVWTAVGDPGDALRYGLIAVSALAMGLQSAGTRLSGMKGINATFITGTLTNAVARTVFKARTPPPREGEAGEPNALPAAVWLSYGAGALVGVFAQQAWGGAAAYIPAGLAALALTIGRFGLGARR